jgi:predicted nucleic acid-binding protein
MFLLDTNVISELRRAHKGTADANVVAWASTVDASELYISAITVQELEIGVQLMERRDAAQGKALRRWLQTQVLPAFDGHILPVDAEVAQRSADFHVPDPHPLRDGFIAATALVHGMAVVTRNTADFEATGVALLNPWLHR